MSVMRAVMLDQMARGLAAYLAKFPVEQLREAAEKEQPLAAVTDKLLAQNPGVLSTMVKREITGLTDSDVQPFLVSFLRYLPGDHKQAVTSNLEWASDQLKVVLGKLKAAAGMA